MAYNFLLALRVAEHASQPLRRAAEAAQLMADAADRLSIQARATNLAILSLAVGADASIGAMSLQAAKLEESLTRLSISTDTTTQSMSTSLKQAEASAREFSTQYSVSATKVVEAQVEIAQAGIAVNEQAAATQGAFKLSRAALGDFGQAAQLMGSLLNTFGKSVEFNYLNPVEKVGAISDRITRVVQKFQVTLPVLAESLKFVIGPASQLNLTLGETVTALGILNTAGFRGSLAGTALSNMFNKLDRAVDKLDLNPDKFVDLNGNLKDLASFLEEVNRALADKTPIEAQNKLVDVFDIRAGRVIKTLLNNIDALKKYSAEVEIASGVTDRFAKTMEQTTISTITRFTNSLVNIGSRLGTGFNETFKEIAVALSGPIKNLDEFVEKNANVISTMVSLGAGAATLSGILLVFNAASVRISGALTTIAAASVTARTGLLLMAGVMSSIKAIALAATVYATSIAFDTLFQSTSTATQKIISFAAIITGSVIAFNVFRGAIIAFTAATAAMAAATTLGARAFAALGLINPIVRIIIVAVGAIYALTSVFRSLADAISSDGGFARLANHLLNLVTIVGGAITSFALLRVGILGASAIAAGSFAALFATLNPVLAVLGGIAVAALTLREAWNALKSVFSQTEVPVAKTVLSIDDLDKRFGNFAERSSRLVNELDRLGKAFRNDVAATGLKGSDFGDLPISKRVTEIFKGGDIPLSSAVKKASEEAGGFKGIVSQLSDTIGVGKISLQKYADAFIEAARSIDPLFDSLNALEQATLFGRNLIDGFDLSLKALAKSSPETAESLRVLVSNVNKALSADSFEGFKEFESRAKENLKTGFDALRRVEIPSLQKIVKQFDAAKISGKDIDLSTIDIRPLIEIDQILERLRGKGSLFAQAISGVEQPMKAITGATKSVENNLKNAGFAGDTYAVAVGKAEKRINDAKSALERFDSGIKRLKDNLATVPDQFKLTDEFKKAQELVDNAEATRIQFVADIDEKQIQTKMLDIFAFISKNGKIIGPQLEKDMKDLAESFGDTVSQGLTGKISGAEIFSKLADDFKVNFANQIRGGISLILADQFAGDFREAIGVATGIIKKFASAGKLQIGLESGDLQAQINDAIQKSIPGLKKITGGDIFKLDDSKLGEKFKDIFTDVSVAIVNADNEATSLFRKLQDIIKLGPATGIEGLRDQATQLRELLAEAGRAGSQDAIRPIESALKATLERLNQGGAPSAINDIKSATVESTNALNVVINSLANVIQMLAPAGSQFAEAIKTVITTISNDKAIQQLNQRSSESKVDNTKIEPKVDTGKIKPVIDVEEAIQSVAKDTIKLPNVDLLSSLNLTALTQELGAAIHRATGGLTSDLSQQLGQVVLAGVTQIQGQIANITDSNQRLIASIVQAATSIGTVTNSLFESVSSKISNLSESIASTLGAASNEFIDSVKSIIPAARQFVEIIQNGFSNALVAVRDTEITTDRGDKLELKITTGQRTITVNLEGAGGSSSRLLDEDEIRKIIGEAKTDLTDEMNEIIRKLEDQLRGR